MRYYLFDSMGNMVGVVPPDARKEILMAAERLRIRFTKKEVINGRMYVRAIGVVL